MIACTIDPAFIASTTSVPMVSWVSGPGDCIHFENISNTGISLFYGYPCQLSGSCGFAQHMAYLVEYLMLNVTVSVPNFIHVQGTRSYSPPTDSCYSEPLEVYCTWKGNCTMDKWTISFEPC